VFTSCVAAASRYVGKVGAWLSIRFWKPHQARVVQARRVVHRYLRDSASLLAVPLSASSGLRLRWRRSRSPSRRGQIPDARNRPKSERRGRRMRDSFARIPNESAIDRRRARVVGLIHRRAITMSRRLSSSDALRRQATHREMAGSQRARATWLTIASGWRDSW
jgi:hypothetical protein